MYSTREAAKKLGVTILTLQRHVSAKTFDAPPLTKVGGVSVRLWSDRDIERARRVLALVKRDSQFTFCWKAPATAYKFRAIECRDNDTDDVRPRKCWKSTSPARAVLNCRGA